MTVGMETYRRIKSAESQADKLGVVFASDPYGSSRDLIYLIPKQDDSLPVYNKRAILFCGDLSTVEAFMTGIEWARSYDTVLGLKTEQRRVKSEQKIRNRRLLDSLKDKSND